MSDFQGKVNFIWSVADELLSDDFNTSTMRWRLSGRQVLRR
jgi:hypothetical protein